MQINIIILLVFLCMNLGAHLPKSKCAKYDEAMINGYRYLNQKNYDKALIEFQAAQIAARECRLNADSTKKPADELKKVFEGLSYQRDEAIKARLEAVKQKAIAEIKTKEALALKEANQNLLARIYWNNSQSARAGNNLLEALHFIAEGVSISKDQDLRQSMLLDIEILLPQYCLKNIIDGDTFNYDSTAGIWNEASRRQLGPTLTHKSVKNAVFSPDGKWMMTTDEDSTARLWDAVSDKQIATDLRHSDLVKSAVFNSDGKWLLTTSVDNARLWDVATGNQIDMKHSVEDMRHRVWDIPISAVFSPDGKKVLTSYNRTIRFWDVISSRQSALDMKHEGVVRSAFFSRDGKWVLTASDSTAYIWDAVSGKKKVFEIKHGGFVNSAVFSPDGKRILTAGSDGTARLWDATNGRHIGPDIKDYSPFLSAVFSPDGKRVLTELGYAAHLWDAANGKQILANINIDDAMNGHSAIFSLDGKRMLTVSNHQITRLWDAASFKQIGPDTKYESFVNSAVLSPDGKCVLITSNDHTARLWNAASGKQIGPDMKHGGEVRSAVFSPDGKWVLTASYDHTARLWDAASGKPLGPALKHEGAVNSAFFSPDGKKIVTASNDSTARLWDVRTDLDIPADLFKKQVMVSTGCQLNVETSTIQLIPTEKWYKLKEEYNTKAREHYKICKYREYNFWSRFNPEEARKIKPKK